MKTTLTTLAACCALTTPLLAEPILEISDAKAFATLPTAMAGAGYLQISNSGSSDAVLTGVTADFPRVQLHTTEFDSEGVAKMMHLDQINIPAGETVLFTPGGRHVMFMGLRGNPLVAGETIEATLIFENAGDVVINFNIVERDMADHTH